MKWQIDWFAKGLLRTVGIIIVFVIGTLAAKFIGIDVHDHANQIVSSMITVIVLQWFGEIFL